MESWLRRNHLLQWKEKYLMHVDLLLIPNRLISSGQRAIAYEIMPIDTISDFTTCRRFSSSFGKLIFYVITNSLT